MDPYLEDPAIWSGFHHAFLSALQERLGPAVRPKYFVRVDERVYVAHKEDPAYRFIVPDVRVIEAARKRPPATSGGAAGGLVIAPPLPVVEMIDPEIHEHRLEILDRVDRSVVTVIEMRSPTNKMPRSVGRDSFLQKRNEVYGTDAHWMEIDLLRDGARTANVAASGEAEYQIYLSRAGKPRRGFVWPVPVRERLPVIGVPLRNGDADVPLDLQAAFDQVYDVGGYDLDLDYRRAPSCPLNPLQAEWAQTILGDRSQP
jgi:hypothetical protein